MAQFQYPTQASLPLKGIPDAIPQQQGVTPRPVWLGWVSVFAASCVLPPVQPATPPATVDYPIPSQHVQIPPRDPRWNVALLPAQPFVYAEPRTRFYIPGSRVGLPAITPADDGSWTTVLSVSRGPAYLTPVADTPETVVDGALNGALQVLYRQAISPPLNGAQTIGYGSIKGQFRAQEPNAARDAFLAWSIRVVSRDGNTVRGTILGHGVSGIEFSTSLVNRKLNGSGASVAAQHGDRLIFEIGVHATYNLFDDIGIRLASGTGSDLPEDDSETSDKNCWIELPGTLVFTDEGSDRGEFHGPPVLLRPRTIPYSEMAGGTLPPFTPDTELTTIVWAWA